MQVNARYAPERILADQPAGRFLVAVDTVDGGRATVFLPNLRDTSPQAFINRIRPEIERLRPLDETDYCALRDVGLADDGAPFAVVRRPQGSSLSAVLRRDGRLGVDRALSITLQLCDLVRRAHAVGLMPAAMEPDAIIVDPRPGGRQHVSIVDLSLTRHALGGFPPADSPPSRFAAPQIERAAPPDPRDDVFAVCGVLHLMVFGVAPPAMDAFGPADGSGWTVLPDDGRGLDRRLEACLHPVFLRGLAPTRDERFPHIGALQRALTGLRQLMSLSAPGFELLAAPRGRLGQGPGGLDLSVSNPTAERAAEARARIRQVVAQAANGGANLQALETSGAGAAGFDGGDPPPSPPRARTWAENGPPDRTSRIRAMLNGTYS